MSLGAILGLAGTLAGVGGSLWSNYSNNKNTDKALEMQAAENEKTRQYNLDLAKKQNEWNIAQWNRENAYNTPAAQKARLQAAGLNPDMMYGGSGVSNTATSSPMMTSGAPASPMDWSSLGNKKTVGSVIIDSLSVARARAEIDNIKSDTESKGLNNQLLSNSLEFQKAYQQGQLDLQNVQIRVADSEREVNLATADKLRKEASKIDVECGSLQSSIDLARAKIRDIDSQIAYRDVQRVCQEKLSDAQLSSLAAKREVDLATAKEIRDRLPYLITQYQDEHVLRSDQHGLNLTNGFILRQQGALLEIDVERAQSHYSNISEGWKHCATAVQFVDDLVGAISPFIGPVGENARKRGR